MEEYNLLFILLLGLASFRLTHLIVYDKITEFIRLPFLTESVEVDADGTEVVYYIPRDRGIRGFIGELISCHWCTGMWMSAGLILFNLMFPYVSYYVILILAVAGIAAIIETIIQLII